MCRDGTGQSSVLDDDTVLLELPEELELLPEELLLVLPEELLPVEPVLLPVLPEVLELPPVEPELLPVLPVLSEDVPSDVLLSDADSPLCVLPAAAETVLSDYSDAASCSDSSYTARRSSFSLNCC